KRDLTREHVILLSLCAVFRERRLRQSSLTIWQSPKSETSPFCLLPSAFLFGGHKAVVRPVPIPNTAVKHSLADGSGFIDSARVGRRQPFKKAETNKFASAFSCPQSISVYFTYYENSYLNGILSQFPR